MAAIRAERDYVIHEDFMKVGCHLLSFYLFILIQLSRHSLQCLAKWLQAVRKLNDAKKLESSAHYSADFGKD